MHQEAECAGDIRPYNVIDGVHFVGGWRVCVGRHLFFFFFLPRFVPSLPFGVPGTTFSEIERKILGKNPRRGETGKKKEKNVNLSWKKIKIKEKKHKFC